MTKVGFIGLSGVGQQLALSLVHGGFEVVVRDADQSAATPVLSAGGVWGYSPRDVAQQCDVLVTCLPSAQLSSDVMEGANGALLGLSEGNLWLEMSATEPSELKRVAKLVETQGALVMDAPSTGPTQLVSHGNASVFVGGSQEAFDYALPVLEAMAAEIVHTGELGTASVMRVVANYLASVHVVSTGEALMVAKRAGIDLAVAYEAIRVSSGNSSTHETDGQAILGGSYNSGVELGRQLKEVTLFDELGKTLDIGLELSPLLVQVMQDGVEAFGPGVWSSMVVKRLEQACETELRAPGFPTDH